MQDTSFFGTKQARRIYFLVAVLCVVLIVLFLSGSKRPPSGKIEVSGPQDFSSSTSIKTREPIDPSIVAPAMNSQVPQNIAQPLSVSPLLRNSKYKLRAFQIAIAENKFAPDTVIVEIGDGVQIDFTAVDKDYDVYQPEYGFKQTIEKGETKPVQFRADATGKYTFFCARCGGPLEGPRGYLMVTERK